MVLLSGVGKSNAMAFLIKTMLEIIVPFLLVSLLSREFDRLKYFKRQLLQNYNL